MKAIFTLLLVALSTWAHAGNIVVFIAGGLDNDQQIIDNAVAFRYSMLGNGVPSSSDFRYFPIPQNYLQAASSFYCQRELGEGAFPTQNTRPIASEYNQYFKNLGNIYSNFLVNALLNPISCTGALVTNVGETTRALADNVAKALKGGNSVTLVGHSQGAAYAEAAVALLFARGDIESLKMVKVVGIASVAFTALGDRYVNSTQDRLNYWTGAITYSPYTVLPNVDLCVSPCDHAATGDELLAAGVNTNAHDLAVYLSDSIFSRQFKVSIPETIASFLVDIPSGSNDPISLFDNLGDRQFVGLNYDSIGALFSVSVSGEQLGLVRNPMLGNKLQGKAAIAFSTSAAGGADLKSIELPIYIQGGTNQVTLSVRRDINGLPDTSSILATDTIVGTLKTVNAFFTDQTFTTTTVNYNPGAVTLLPNTRYWIEATAPDTTVATWPYGRTSASALVASSSGGAPYATGDSPPAIRIVVTPK